MNHIKENTYLTRLSEVHKQYLKSAFERLNFTSVCIHTDHLEINGQTVHLLPLPEYPEYTNEMLQMMPLPELLDLAVDFGFKFSVFGCRDSLHFIEKYGAVKTKKILKGYIYTHRDNHPIRCMAKTLRSGLFIDLGKMLWTYLKLREISSKRYDILAYTKPVRNIFKVLELE